MSAPQVVELGRQNEQAELEGLKRVHAACVSDGLATETDELIRAAPGRVWLGIEGLGQSYSNADIEIRLAGQPKPALRDDRPQLDVVVCHGVAAWRDLSGVPRAFIQVGARCVA